jgi:mannosyltransferase OCH1-like enzyme
VSVVNDNPLVPKIIHYCWFGGKDFPPLALKCMKSWKNYCADYEIWEWNEHNFDINCNRYVQEAFQKKKWAFVTDYVRLKVLLDYGGIYMDTDVELVKPLDEFLCLPAFSGFESDKQIPTGLIGAMPRNRWIGQLLTDYKERAFIAPDGSYDLTTNVLRITQITKHLYDIKLNNTRQDFPHFSIFPVDWFCAKSHRTGKINRTENTYAIHHFSGSWMTSSQKLKLYLTRMIGEAGMKKLSKQKQWLLGRRKQ